MALVFSINCNFNRRQQPPLSLQNPNFDKFSLNTNPHSTNKKLRPWLPHLRVVNGLQEESTKGSSQDDEENSLGVKAALSMLKFYKREISPLMPNSCRYVPTCSEYSMIAYKKYGVVKGTVLTAWRLCRCNPLGSSGYDPPRRFDEPSPSEP